MIPGLLAEGGAAAAVLSQAADGAQALTPTVGYDLTAVFVFTLFGIAFVVGTVALISRLLRPKAAPSDEPAKGETYECGEPAVGSSWVRFDIRFYTVALIFLVFDVEVAFLYPWAVVFKGLRAESVGFFVFIEMLIFIAILLVGFIYCWRKGDMDWVKSKGSQQAKSTLVTASGDGATDAGEDVRQEAAVAGSPVGGA